MTAPRALAIVGPTASGKSALALELANRLPGIELISVDAFAVYRGLDIGTDKPTAAARAAARWHLIDVAAPDEEFSVSRFVALCDAARAEIARRGGRAAFVGGTGLYHRAVIDGLRIPPRYPEVLARLEAEADEPGGLARLYQRLSALDPLASTRIEPANRRRLLRALEVTIGSGVPFSAAGPGLESYPPSPVLQIGLRLERGELDRRIAARLERQMASGFLDEVRTLSERPGGLSRTARQALGYRELLAHLAGEASLDEALGAMLLRTRRFARRQLSWFGRDPRICWLDATRDDLADAAEKLARAGVNEVT